MHVGELRARRGHRGLSLALLRARVGRCLLHFLGLFLRRRQRGLSVALQRTRVGGRLRRFVGLFLRGGERGLSVVLLPGQRRVLSLRILELVVFSLELLFDRLQVLGFRARLLLRAGNGELGLVQLLVHFGKVVLRRSARRDGLGERFLRVDGLFLQIGRGASRFLQIRQIGGDVLPRNLGAPRLVIHLGSEIAVLRPEKNGDEPPHDGERQERERNGTTKIADGILTWHRAPWAAAILERDENFAKDKKRRIHDNEALAWAPRPLFP